MGNMPNALRVAVPVALMAGSSLATAQRPSETPSLAQITSATRPTSTGKQVLSASGAVEISIPADGAGSLLAVHLSNNGCSASYELHDPSGKKIDLRNDQCPVGPGTYIVQVSLSGKGVREEARAALSWTVYRGHAGSHLGPMDLSGGSGYVLDCLASWRDKVSCEVQVPAGRWALVTTLATPLDDWFGMNLWKQGWRARLNDAKSRPVLTVEAQEASSAGSYLVVEPGSPHRFSLLIDSDSGNFNPTSPFLVCLRIRKLAPREWAREPDISGIAAPQLAQRGISAGDPQQPMVDSEGQDLFGLRTEGLIYRKGHYDFPFNVPAKDARGGVLSYGIAGQDGGSGSATVFDRDGMVVDGYRGNGRTLQQTGSWLARPLAAGPYTFALDVNSDPNRPSQGALVSMEAWLPAGNGTRLHASALSGDGATVSGKLTSWWDINWFRVTPGPRNGARYFALQFTPAKTSEFGINLWDNGYKVSVLERDGMTCVASGDVGAGSSGVLRFQPRSAGPYYVRISSDGGSYNAHDPYQLKAFWTSSDR
jgi:hypothetical protein